MPSPTEDDLEFDLRKQDSLKKDSGNSLDFIGKTVGRSSNLGLDLEKTKGQGQRLNFELDDVSETSDYQRSTPSPRDKEADDEVEDIFQAAARRRHNESLKVS